MTLVEFLKARLDEDEQVAKAATVGPWRVVNVTDYGSATVDGPDALQDGGYDEVTKTRRQVMRPQTVISQDVDYGPTVRLGNAEHIACHDPARVLREVEAKRRLLAEYVEYAENDTDKRYEYADGWANGLGFAVRLLALPYADHADYRAEWAV